MWLEDSIGQGFKKCKHVQIYEYFGNFRQFESFEFGSDNIQRVNGQVLR